MVRNVWRFVLLTLISFFLLLAGCGRKTMPIPPDAVIPTAIKDLTLLQDESRVVLSWTYPGETTIGTELNNIEGFQILRAVLPEDDFCETCPVSLKSAAYVSFDSVVKDRQKRKAQYTEIVLRPGHRYLYQVRTRAGWRLLSKESNMVSFVWEAPLAAPSALRLDPGDKEMEVSWQEVRSRTNGVEAPHPLTYQVYRRSGKKEFVPVSQRIQGSQYRDLGLVNGRLYDYKVRAVFSHGTTTIYGIASSVLSGQPQDLSAPIPPHNLTAVRVAEGVKLIWERGGEPDIAGYKIFRRVGTDAERVLIGETEGRTTIFVDKAALGQQKLLYSITSFDRAKPVNESIFSKEVVYESF